MKEKRPYTNGVPNPRGIAPRGAVATGAGADTSPPQKKAPAQSRGDGGPNPFIKDKRGIPVGPSHAAIDLATGHSSMAVNVKGLISQLRNAGYDLPRGVQTLTPTVLSALRDFLQPTKGHPLSPALENKLGGSIIPGARNPDRWNQRFGTPRTKSNAFRKNTGPGGALDPQGHDITNKYAGGTVDLSSPAGLATDTGTKIPLSLAKFGNMIDPATADAIAGQQFDPQISEAKLVLSHDPLQALQDTKNINSWYQQALNSLDTAAGRDYSGEQAGVKSINDATQSIVNSLGGSANAGAGVAAAAGQNASGTLAALGQAEDQYNNDLGPLLQAEKAEQAIGQGNKDRNQQQADQVALENLQGQRGQAVTSTQDQIRQENNALAQARAAEAENIRNSNNSLTQQGFNNALALAQAQIAAMMSGLNVQTKTAALGKATNPGAFAYATPTVKNAAATAAMGALFDPTTGKKLPLTPAQARTLIAKTYGSYGWNPTNPSVAGAINNVYNAYQVHP